MTSTVCTEGLASKVVTYLDTCSCCLAVCVSWLIGQCFDDLMSCSLQSDISELNAQSNEEAELVEHVHFSSLCPGSIQKHCILISVLIMLLTCHVHAEARSQGKQESASTPASPCGCAQLTTAAPTCHADSVSGHCQQQQWDV